MKTWAAVRGGALGGVIVTVLWTAAGQLLDVGIEPWSWTTTATGYVARAVEWGRTAVVLLPFGLLFGVATGVVCALAFEYITERAGWLIGALVGLVPGVAIAATAGLVPWLASLFSLAFMPPDAPLGRHDPIWMFVTFVVAGLVAGACAGASYGPPLRASRVPAAFKWREVYPTTRRFS